jgi:hypothetical protein
VPGRCGRIWCASTCSFRRAHHVDQPRRTRFGRYPRAAPFYASCTTRRTRARMSMGNARLIQRGSASANCQWSSGRFVYSRCILPTSVGRPIWPIANGYRRIATSIVAMGRACPARGKRYCRALSSVGAAGDIWVWDTLDHRAIIPSIAVRRMHVTTAARAVKKCVVQALTLQLSS